MNSMLDLTSSAHIRGLEKKNARLKRQLRCMQEASECRNQQLAASEFVVWCTGCIPGAPANYQNMTEEKVKAVEHIANRLRTWWTANRSRVEGTNEK